MEPTPYTPDDMNRFLLAFYQMLADKPDQFLSKLDPYAVAKACGLPSDKVFRVVNDLHQRELLKGHAGATHGGAIRITARGITEANRLAMPLPQRVRHYPVHYFDKYVFPALLGLTCAAVGALLTLWARGCR